MVDLKKIASWSLLFLIVLYLFCASTAEGRVREVRGNQRIRVEGNGRHVVIGYDRYAYRRYRRNRDHMSNRRRRREWYGNRYRSYRVRRGRHSTPIRLQRRYLKRYNRLRAGRVIVYEKGKRPYVR